MTDQQKDGQEQSTWCMIQTWAAKAVNAVELLPVEGSKGEGDRKAATLLAIHTGGGSAVHGRDFCAARLAAYLWFRQPPTAAPFNGMECGDIGADGT